MVANLPYNVGTPLVLQTLQRAPRVTRLVIMLQREAIDRFVAVPGSRTYGVPSVIVALHANASVVLRVPGHVFTPPTPVSSSVVVMDRIEPHRLTSAAITLAAAAFGQRRKMLRSSLRTVIDDPGALLEEAGIEPTRRAEELAPDDFLRLAGAA
jgi:16S rRNA (adenine1518-N6/adenine1519-N6)-dimethyltransferase